MKQPRVSAHSAMSIAAAYEAAVPRRMSNRIRNMAREPTGRTDSPAGERGAVSVPRVDRQDWARIWFASNALVVLVGLLIQIPVAMDNDSGYFDTPLKRGLNVFVFFTVQSNIIVGVTSFLLALRLQRSALVFRVFRLNGVVGIALDVHRVPRGAA